MVLTEHQSRVGSDLTDPELMRHAREVGKEFVYIYYLSMNECPQDLHRFYSGRSLFVHGGRERPGHEAPPVVGQQAIAAKIRSLCLRDCRTKILMVDSVPAPDSGVLIQVCGEISNDAGPMRRFMQTFLMAPLGPKKYYVQNNIFRYQDEVFTDCDHSEESLAEAQEQLQLQQQQEAPLADAVSVRALAADAQLPESAPAGFGDDADGRAAVNGDGKLLEAPEPFVDGPHPLMKEEPLLKEESATREEPLAAPAPEEAATESQTEAAAPEAASTAPKEPVKKNFASLFGSGPSAATQQPLPQRRQQPQQQQQQQHQQRNGSHAPGPEAPASNVVVGGGGGGRDEGHQIFVGNLLPDTREEELQKFFEHWGDVVSCRITHPKAKAGHSFANFGFVGFASADSMQAVLAEESVSMNGNRLNVEQKKAGGPSGQRRGGGGGGGGGRGGRGGGQRR